MADEFPDEGLDVILGVFPRGGTIPANLYVGLFTGGSASTVPTSAATIAAMTGTFAEVTTGSAPTGWPSYLRQAIASTTSGWGAPGAQTIWSVTGRGVVGGQVSFPTPVAAYAPTNPVNGFFIADASTSGHAIYYSNFSDTTGVAGLAIGDVIKVTPTFGYGN
jgi:hypothetical protein